MKQGSKTQRGRKACRITLAATIVIGLSSIFVPSWAAWQGYKNFTDPSGFYAQAGRGPVG